MMQIEEACGKRVLQRNARQKRILELARDSFLEHGYAATSMSAIAASVGGSKATFWKHFRSKQELFSAVLDSATCEYREHLRTILRPSRDLEGSIIKFCRSYVDILTSPDAIKLHRLVTGEVGRFPEVGAIFQERVPDLTQRLLTQFLAEKSRAGELNDIAPSAMAAMILSLCMGGLRQRVLWGHVIRSPLEVEEEARMIAAVFMRAFRTRAAGQSDQRNPWPLPPSTAIQ